ncbi:MAG: class A beta-lactamase [bacterium]
MKPKSYIRFTIIILMMTYTLCLSSVSATTLTDKIHQIEKQYNAQVGVAVYDTGNKALWDYNGDTRFPMMSTFKTLACAKLLAAVDQKSLSLATQVKVEQDMLVSYSPVSKQYLGKKMSLNQACTASMLMSDNTAANIIINAIGGPQELNRFLRQIGDNTTRLDRYETDLNQALKDDPRDTTTARAMVKTLDKILYGHVLSDSSKQQLLQWMIDTKITGSLLRSVLPDGYLIADRSGAGGHGSRGITAVVWSSQRPALIISIYLTQSTASFKQRNTAIAETGAEIFKQFL